MPSLPAGEDRPSPSRGGDDGPVSPTQNLAQDASRHVLRVPPTPIPPAVAGALWRGDSLGRGTDTVWPSGFEALDAELPGGGWPARQLTEVLMPQFSLAEWRLVGPALRGVVKRGAPAVLVGPPKRPHLPGLMHLGLDEHRVVWIQAQAPSERLWCAEQLIKSNAAGAVLAWVPQAAPEQLRRLQVLAQSFEGPVFLFRPLEARHDPSPAPLRLEATIDVDWALHVRVLKRKGPAHEPPLRLPSVPGGLALVLTPRVMRPSEMRPVPAPVAVPSPSHAPAGGPASAPVSAPAPMAVAAAASFFPELHDVVGRPDSFASSADAGR
ncbi:translesion DNA synthesis-associated protein ImuA [Roseateles aquatilis]|uniref:translesion DNA synthesis-associated protein ImuA n=1 Tax=Roseateles aquatilis TaxID=431061 RepID=UPI001131F662|nr:translesion DNA synthesis-associated protein ImuA [Roseateles aquatilis]